MLYNFQMLSLPQVTLIGIDCVDVARLQLAFDISTKEINFGEVKLLTSLPTDDIRSVSIEPLLSIEAYSEFCLKELFKFVETPYALIIQHDGFILNGKAWTNDFLNYDYIGAPIFIKDWSKEKHGLPDGVTGNLIVGNGGFSLRSAKLMSLTAELYCSNSFVKDEPEDWAMCYTERLKLQLKGIKFAPIQIAETFSFEGRSKDYYQYQKSFGFHSFRWTDISNWLEKNTQYKDVIVNNVLLGDLE